MGVFKSKYFVRQHDAMECGIACIAMIARYLGLNIGISQLTSDSILTPQGNSLMGLSHVANTIKLDSVAAKVTLEQLQVGPKPCILHWNQNHYVVLYKVKKDYYYIADPGKGLLKLSKQAFFQNWNTYSEYSDDECAIGIVLYLAPRKDFNIQNIKIKKTESTRVIEKYISRYKNQLLQVLFGLLIGCLLQLLLPFLTQNIVDIGIHDKKISVIWLILLGELMIIIGRTATDYVRRWLLLHISVRVNVSIISEFFIKLLSLPMIFFEAKQIGDLLQRMGDYSRIQTFLTGQVLSIIFSIISFVIYGFVLFIFNKIIFCIFLVGSLMYGGWIFLFLRKRESIDYELFNQQAINQNKTFQLITKMQ